jgi:hypothetical protein
MDGNAAIIWFIAMTLTFFTMLAFGTYLASHSYVRARGAVQFHRPHLHRPQLHRQHHH